MLSRKSVLILPLLAVLFAGCTNDKTSSDTTAQDPDSPFKRHREPAQPMPPPPPTVGPQGGLHQY